MISYEPLWSTMRRKGVTTYTLIKDYAFKAWSSHAESVFYFR